MRARRLKLAHLLQHGERNADIAHNSQRAEIGNNLAQKFEALGADIGGLAQARGPSPIARVLLQTSRGRISL